MDDDNNRPSYLLILMGENKSFEELDSRSLVPLTKNGAKKRGKVGKVDFGVEEKG